VYALRWESARTGKRGWTPAVEGGWANAKKPGRTYLPLDEGVVESHLAGESHLGLWLVISTERVGYSMRWLSRRCCRHRRSRRARAITLWRRGAHLDVLLLTYTRLYGSTPGSAYPAPGDGGPSRARSLELRPTCPHPGLRSEGILREPDRPPAPGSVPATREHRLSRPSQPRALRGPVGAPGVDSAGVDVPAVSGRLGHKNPSTTLNVYSQFVPETDQEAAAADALGRILEDAANPTHD